MHIVSRIFLTLIMFGSCSLGAANTSSKQETKQPPFPELSETFLLELAKIVVGENGVFEKPIGKEISYWEFAGGKRRKGPRNEYNDLWKGYEVSSKFVSAKKYWQNNRGYSEKLEANGWALVGEFMADGPDGGTLGYKHDKLLLLIEQKFKCSHSDDPKDAKEQESKDCDGIRFRVFLGSK